jgi:hypothetical protein
VGRGSVTLLRCEVGVVNVVRGGTWEDKVGGVWRGEKGDVRVCVLDGLEGGGSVCFIESVEFGPGGSGGSGGGH